MRSRYCTLVRSRYARGAVEVRSRYACGAVEVPSWCARGAVERSRYALGTVLVRSRYASGSVRFVNFSTGDTVHVYTVGVKKVPIYCPYNGTGNSVPFPFNFRAVAVHSPSVFNTFLFCPTGSPSVQLIK